MNSRFALFGLAFLLISSGLVVVLPESATAATTYTWDAPADGIASLDTNWDPVGVPTTGDTIIFDGTSVFNCTTWDLAITTGNFSMLTGFTGKVTLGANLGVSSFYQLDGIFTGSLSYVFTCAGDLYSGGTGSVSANLLRICMTGEGSTLTAIGADYILRGLQISANVVLRHTSPNASISFPQSLSSYLIVDIGKTVTLSDAPITRFYIYLHSDFTFTNSGVIAGPTTIGGDVQFRTWLTSPTVTFGAITASVLITSHPADSQTVYLGANTIFTSNLALYSSGVTGTNHITLHHGLNYTLTVLGSVSIGGRANLSQGTGLWSFGSFIETATAGSFTQDSGELALSGNFTTPRSTITPNLIIDGDTYLVVGRDMVGVNLPSYYDLAGLTNFSGPSNRLTESPNGDYLAFVREGSSHVEVGDYAVMNLYRSTDDGATFVFESELKNISTRDVRNYASGVSESGRVFVFYAVYDVDNETWEDMVQYMYSDDNGASWSSGISMDIPVIDGLTYTAGSPFGTMIVVGDGRIGMAHYGNNVSHSQARFAYSDDDGLTWEQSAISLTYLNWQHRITETEIFYLGNDAIVSLSRINGQTVTEVHTSEDNGLTWATQGNITKPMGAFPPSMTSILDSGGRSFILTIYAYNSIYYSFAKVSDVLAKGPDAWSTCIQMSETTTEGMYASMVIDVVSGDGIIMVNNQTDLHNSTMRIINMTASVDSSSMIMGNLTVDSGSMINFDDDGYIVDYCVAHHVVNNGLMNQNDKNINITGESITPLTGFGLFDGDIYLNGSIASSYIVQTGLPMGNLHTDRDTTIYIDAGTYLRVTPSTIAFLNISILNQDVGNTLLSWSLEKDPAISSVSYAIFGLPTSYGYRVFQDGVVIAAGVGPVFEFTITADGEFEIQAWYGREVSSLIVLTVNMVGLGIMLGVLGTLVVPLARDIQKGKNIKPERVTRDLIRTVIFIVVGCVMWIVLHSIAIG